MKAKIYVLACGGTISSVSKIDGELPTPGKSGEDIVRSVPGLAKLADLEVENYSKVLSSQLTVEQLYGLGQRIRTLFAEREDIDGIVVTHGTGSIEESSWMVDLLVDDRRPVVYAGAMRSASDPFSDGPFNLFNAVQVASSKEAQGRGTLVVMNGVIHAARYVMKMHTMGADTFRSGEFGPLGYVYPDRVFFARENPHRVSVYTDSPEFNVDLIKFVVGMDDRFVRASVAAGAKAIVLEGSGLGNVNDAVMEGVVYALENGVTVVVCSRSPEGRVFPAYGTTTGAGALLNNGCLLASLPGPKVRIMMMLFGSTTDKAEMQRLLDPQ